MPIAVAALLAAAQLIAAPPQAPDDASLAAFENLSRAFRSVYEDVAPAVVLIRTSGSAELRLPRFHPPIDPQDHGESSGLGSGVIVSADGYILSNFHVIQNADSIEVTLHDRRRLVAHVVGVDSLIDIALLKVEADNLPTATLGTSADLQIGDWVLAIGFPLGMGSTFTHGIVSALGRQAEVIRDVLRIESFIQTDAVINPGNSGGPLLDLRGRVVGINTAISTKTGYFMGYGLAVPIDLAHEAMDDFLQFGRVVRGYLGIQMEEVDAQLVSQQGLQLGLPRGVFVAGIDDNTPAARSDLAQGDVLLAVDGQPVNEPNEVQTLIYGRDPGESVVLHIVRDGVEQSVDVLLGEREDDRALARGHQRVEQLGLTVASLDNRRATDLGFSPIVARQLGLADNRDAVVVIDIDPDSPAAQRGMRVDDIITEIDQSIIESPDELVRFLSGLDAGESAMFWFWRREIGIDVRALPINRTE
jgi:serine protease Do